MWPWTTKPVLGLLTQSLGYICNNSQNYIVWVKIIVFLMSKIIRTLRTCSMNIFSKFPTVNISNCHDLGLLLLSLSLSLCCTHTHTHTHSHTHAYWHLHLSLSPTCLLFQSAFALLCSATCSHSFNQSLYFTASALVALCRIIVYHALYVFSCFFIVLRSCTLSCLAWRCWEFLVLPRCPAAASS